MHALVIDRGNRAAHAALLDAMHRHRRRIFVETLGWRALEVETDREIDAFDTEDATYLIVRDSDGALRGSARFLETTGPHMLDGPLSHFIDGDCPRGPDVVEWSRHAPGDPAWAPEINAAARIALNIGAMEWAVERGVTGFVAVLERWLMPRARAFGWTCTPLCPPRSYGEGDAIAVHIPLDASTLDVLKQRHNRRDPVLLRATDVAA